MQETLKSFFLSLLILTSLVLTARAQEFPPQPNRLVNDYTNTLTPAEIEQLEQKLVAFDDSTSTQVAVVLMQSVGAYDIADYTVRLAEKWGVGREKKNNGVVLLAALGDRKVTIQTGYGVEGALPDAIAKRIIEREIKPSFRDGNYYEGLDRATDAIIAYTKGEYKNEDAGKRQDKGKFPIGLIILVIALILIFSRRGGRGGGRVIGGRGGADVFWWTLMSGMGRHRHGGGWGGFTGGGGGSGGGGGFGGFGGGSFGGGGASGDW